MMPDTVLGLELTMETERRAADAPQLAIDVSQPDLRNTKLWEEIARFHTAIQKPAYGKISHASDLQVSPQLDGFYFTGSYWDMPNGSNDELVGAPATRICFYSTLHKEMQMATRGPNNDKLARWSPDGQSLLFLSDRSAKGVFQPYLLKRWGVSEAELLVEIKDKSVEYAEWSPNGAQILLGLAGLDADNAAAGQAGGSGKVGHGKSKSSTDSWLPSVSAKPEENQWRRLWILDVGSRKLTRLDTLARNPWEAGWAGNERIITVSSAQPGEDSWYESDIEVIDIGNGQIQRSTVQQSMFEGKMRQFGSPVGSVDGKAIAFIRCLASDRGLTAGDIYVAKVSESGQQQSNHKVFKLNVGNTDVTFLKFVGSDSLVYAGVSSIGFSLGEIRLLWKDDNLEHFGVEEVIQSSEACADPYHPKLAVSLGFAGQTTFDLILQSRCRPPEIVRVEKGAFSTMYSLDHPGYRDLRSRLGTSAKMTWKSSDGLEIQGILDLPRARRKNEKYPLILNVHGGPVASWQNTWTGWNPLHYLVARGYAVLSPNPRGSSGHGQRFAERVLKDVGGMEVKDHLSGIDHLINQGIIDPNRIGVMGGSHGGFMASWIISQDGRFKACVPLAAVNDWHAQHFTTNIPTFDTLFLGESPYRVGSFSKYINRSPIMLAEKIKTPVLQMAGEVDYCVDSSQAKEFHNALLENGVESVLVVYPGEGHGVRKFPAVVDMQVRTAAWFERWMPAYP